MFSYLYFYLAQTYTITCNKNGKNCKLDGNLDGDYTEPITLPNYVFEPDFDYNNPPIIDTPIDDPTSNNLELVLSTDLAMFLTHLLHFIIFHATCLCICWLCTMSFRASSRR